MDKNFLSCLTLPLFLAIIAACMIGCRSNTRNIFNPNIIYTIVPDQYKGFMVVHFNTAGGKDVFNSNGAEFINIGTNGLAQTSLTKNQVLPHFFTQMFINKSGQPIPVDDLTHQSKRIVCGGDINLSEDGKLDIAIWWLGDPDEYKSFRNTDKYNTALDDFLKARIGLTLFSD